jgi:hypothetical protein
MSSVASRIYAQRIVSYVQHTNVSGETWTYIKAGTTTGAGASDGTTVVDSNGDSGGADTYNGQYFVRILSGACKGLRRRVIDDNGTGTLTLEGSGFPAQIASGVEYQIEKSPEPVIVVDSSSGATDCVDAGRNDESDDFWKGYYVVPLTGSRRGKMALITAFTQSTGTFVLAAGLGGALAAGDVCVLRKYVHTSEPQLGLDEPYIPRPQKHNLLSSADGTVGARSGTVGFNAQVTASGSLAAAASKANPSVLNGLLEASGLEETIGTSMLVTGGTASAPTVTTATGERCTVGQMLIWNGNPTFVDSVDDGAGSSDTVNVSPALPGTPQSGDVLYATRMYARSPDGDHRAVTIEVELDGIRTIMTGCRGNVTFQGEQVLEAAFAFTIDDWERQVEPLTLGATYHSAVPILATSRACWLDSTRADMGSVTTSPNSTVAPRDVQGAAGINGRAGLQHIDNHPTLTYRELLSSSGDLDQDLRWLARTAKKFSIAWGSHGNCLGLRLPVGRHMESPHPMNSGGLVGVPSVIEAQDAGYATTNLTTTKVPDYSLSLP